MLVRLSWLVLRHQVGDVRQTWQLSKTSQSADMEAGASDLEVRQPR